jgi:signal transduction histidine kinase
LNGRVEIESAPGQGTSVMVEIPLGREDGQPDGRAEDRA